MATSKQDTLTPSEEPVEDTEQDNSPKYTDKNRPAKYLLENKHCTTAEINIYHPLEKITTSDTTYADLRNSKKDKYAEYVQIRHIERDIDGNITNRDRRMMHRITGTLVKNESVHGSVVHHKNRLKIDNRPENLSIMSSEKHNQLHSNIGKKKYEANHPTSEYFDCAWFTTVRGEYQLLTTVPDAPEYVNYHPDYSEYTNFSRGLRHWIRDYIEYTPACLVKMPRHARHDDVTVSAVKSVTKGFLERDEYEIINFCGSDIINLWGNIYATPDMSLSELDSRPKSGRQRQHDKHRRYILCKLRDEKMISRSELYQALSDYTLCDRDPEEIQTALDKFTDIGIIDYCPQTGIYTDPNADVNPTDHPDANTSLHDRLPVL